MVHLIAERIAVPVLPGLARRAGESVEAWNERIGGSSPEKIAGVLVYRRSDRPLLRQGRIAATDEDLALIAPGVRLAGLLAGQDAARTVSGHVGVPRGRLSPALRDELTRGLRRYAPDLVDSPDAEFFLGPTFIVSIPFDGGKRVHVSIRTGRSFDPEPYRRFFIVNDPSSMPDGLRQHLRAPLAPEPDETLGALTTRLARSSGVDLQVDRRAAEWRVTIDGTASCAAADLAEMAARTHNLYWRPVADGWTLAASPADPTELSTFLREAGARAALFPFLAALARQGAIPEIALAGLAARYGGEVPASIARNWLAEAARDPANGKLATVLKKGGRPDLAGIRTGVVVNLGIRTATDFSVLGVTLK